MKKTLLVMIAIGAFLTMNAQDIDCGEGDIKRWAGTGLPGDVGPGPAPISIDGNSTDWIQNITGPFSYFDQPVPTFQPDPHLAPIAPANIQFDDLKGEAGEQDRPGQSHRDLRYFAFTYDQQNVFFYFRRPAKNSAQVAFYYFMDINLDGYMRTGEPVVKIIYHGNTASISMMYFQEDNSSNSVAAGSWVENIGNSMTATVARTGNNQLSDWVVGAADGWSIPGSVKAVPETDLPALTAGEVFSAVGLTDTYSDGATETGYGVEFSVPWNYFRLYGGVSYPDFNPLSYRNIFSWHVSVENGANTNSADDEDNSGGCCSGLAISGQPSINRNGVFGSSPDGVPEHYRVNISYSENLGVPTKVSTPTIMFENPRDANNVPLSPAAVQSYVLNGYIDEDCDGNADGPAIIFSYLNTIGTDYYFSALDATAVAIVRDNPGCFYVDINTTPGGFPPFKRANVKFFWEANFDINSIPCVIIQNATGADNLDALPVKLNYFTAKRISSDVQLNWQTALEEKNEGFDIERKIGTGNWEKIGTILSKAQDGTSDLPLSYQFTDLNNNTKGISEYRLRQVDIDGRSSYSTIRSVRGEGQRSKTIVYPNPSSDGRVSIIFDDAESIRDVSVMDMSGRTIRQWKGITNNNIQVDNLGAGFYTVRIVNTATGEQVVEKFVINKR